jgi:hypothetical protein
MSDAYPLLVAAPILGLAVYCVSQVALSRLRHAAAPYASLTGGFLCGLFAVMGIAAAALARMQPPVMDSLGFLAINLLTYLAFAFGYFNFVNLNIASVRIRVLQELWLSGGCMAKDRLRALYNTDGVIALRLERLTRGGHLLERQGRYYTGNLRFLLVAKLFDGLRRLILGS